MTIDNFEETTIEYELWKSLELLEISSLKEFQSRFSSSEVYDSCREYFADRKEGQVHYSNLLKLVDKALSNTEKYRQAEANRISGG